MSATCSQVLAFPETQSLPPKTRSRCQAPSGSKTKSSHRDSAGTESSRSFQASDLIVVQFAYDLPSEIADIIRVLGIAGTTTGAPATYGVRSTEH